MGLTANFNKPLVDVTPSEVQGLIEGHIKAANPLYSEEFSRANSQVRASGNPALIEAFTDTAAILMQNQYAPGGGHGFALRNSTGMGVLEMLRAGDTAVLDRTIQWGGDGDPVMLGSLKTLRAELKAHCVEQGLRVHSTHIVTPEKKAPAAKPA
jgi:hypothetical protein